MNLDHLASMVASIAPKTQEHRRAVQLGKILLAGTVVAKERDTLADRLQRQWDWLDAHPGHPELESRTDRWIANLRHYEQLCDALISVRRLL